MLVARSEFMRGKRATSETARTKNRGGLFERHLQPLEQLPHRWLVGREQARWLRRKLEMKIADGPADSRCRRRRELERNFDDRLRDLFDDIAFRARLEKRFSVLQRLREFESKLRAVLRRAAPEAFRERD